MTLAEMNDEFGAARTNKKEFLNKMDSVIPWETFVKEIEPYYYKGERGNKPYPLELMLRIYMLQNLYDLADMKVMYEILDSRAFTEFCCINSPDEVPDGDTIGRFRNLLNKYGLQQTIFETVVDLLLQRGLILKKGTIVDSTFIEAPSSTKNKEKKRDPEAHSAKKGNTWHFGYKMHIGVDRDSGLVHHVKTTSANEHDVTATSELMHGEEETLNGDMQINAPKQSGRTSKARKSNILSTESNHLSISSLKADNTQQKRESMKNHLFAAKLNMFLQL